MHASTPDDAPKPESADTATDTADTPERAEQRGGADNTGAIEANQVNPDLPLIQPAAD